MTASSLTPMLTVKNAVAAIDSKQKLYAIVAGVVAVVIAALFVLGPKKKKKKKE